MFSRQDNRSKINITSRDILEFLGFGGILLAAIVAPNAIQAFKFLLKDKEYVSWEKFNKSRARYYVDRLEKQNLIKRAIKNHQKCYILTDKGRRFILKYDMAKLQLTKPKKWDGRWRMVIFDIPEKKRVARDALREKFNNLGMYQLQKSVFIYPFDCKKEIDFISDYFGVANDILYSEAKIHEIEDKLKDFFSLR